MKQKERIMPREGQDILECLVSYQGEDTYGTVAATINKINEFKAAGQPFVIIFQAGAGAPVADFMTEWKQAGLAGCTGELVACKTSLVDANVNVIVINTMTRNEQAVAHDAVKNAKNVDVSGMNFINDPEQLFFKLFDMMNNVDMSQVRDRVAYRPQAIVCDSSSKVLSVIRNEPAKLGEPRDSADYIDQIKEALKKPIPQSYMALRASQAAEAAARASSSRPNSPKRN
jgi:hypothetical protein